VECLGNFAVCFCNIYHTFMTLIIYGSHIRPKIKIAVVPVTRPTLRFAPKKTTQIILLGIFFKVVFMLPTSFLAVDISQYYLSVPLVCVKKLVFSNISKKIAFGQHSTKHHTCEVPFF
jgi:hypothetical protein